MFGFIKVYFEMGLYTKDDLNTFKTAGMITDDEYKTITGEDYVAQTAE